MAINLDLSETKVFIEEFIHEGKSIKLYGVFSFATYVTMSKYTESIISKFEITKNSDSMVAPLTIKSDAEQEKLIKTFLDTQSQNAYLQFSKEKRKVVADVVEKVMNDEFEKFKEKLSGEGTEVVDRNATDEMGNPVNFTSETV